MSGVQIVEVDDIAAEWDDIERLLLGLLEYHRPWDKRTLRADWAERMQRSMTLDSSITLLARDDTGRSVAFLNGVVAQDQGMFEEVSAFISNVFVEADARALGVGSALVMAFEERAQNAGATEIRLRVTAGNQSGEAFWSRSGFQTADHGMLKPLRATP